MRLLLVEDDVMIGETVLDVLRAEHFAVDWVKDGAMADTAMRSQHYDLILLDLGLPKRDGLDVLKSLRQRKDATPVIVVTARDAVADRIAGLDAGADDYVLKPYDLDELLARIRALIRRGAGRPDPVLEALMVRPGSVLSRAQLEEKLYSWKDDISSNAVEVYVHGLRKKLGSDLIQTVRGLGYALAAP